ncbi:hypothetical protein LCGC14_3162990 [marine sediment metagenome]|uniref:Uncharacterized protein n=1 Tax=marine sediment metagenome TaxID=412755 RepID=A0A0F8VQL7_9ZZZZ
MPTPQNPRFWLPPGPINPAPKDEKDYLLNEIKELGYFIPGARDLELQYLRDLRDSCKEKKAKQDEVDKKAAEAGRKAVEAMDQKQVQGALKEYLDWRRKKRGISSETL